MKLPKDNQWIQTNRSDVLGSLQGSFNIDLNTNLSKIRTTRMIQTTSQGGIHGLSTEATLVSPPCGFKLFNDNGTTILFTVAGLRAQQVITNVYPSSPFVLDATSPITFDSTLTDIEVFNGHFWATSGVDNKLNKRTAGGGWSVNGTGLIAPTTFGTHMLCVFPALNRLYISNANGTIYSMDAATETIATSSTNTLKLDPQYHVTCMRPSSNRIWVCTLNPYGKGYIYEWDGVTTQATKGYVLDSNGALACVIKDDIPYVMDADGRVLVLEGGTFKEKARLPINEKYLKNPTSLTNTRFVHPNGGAVINGKVCFLINNEIHDNAASVGEFCPSGIWEYSEVPGSTMGSLTHKRSLSYTPTGTTTVHDYGQNRVSAVGALAVMKIPTTAASANGTILAGATVFTDATLTDVGIFTNDTLEALSGSNQATQKGAYIVTEKIYGDDIMDTWDRVVPFYKKFLSSNDNIVLRYRTDDPLSVEVTTTWSTTTKFTTTTDLRNYVGYEVEFLQGVGSGFCANITLVDVAAGVYTVTIDTAFTNATGTGKARIQKWTKIGKVQDITSQFNNKMKVDKKSPWVQYKVCMYFTHPAQEMDQLLLVNKLFQKLI